jgi:hypothetical protein
MKVMADSILDDLGIARDIPDQDGPVRIFLGILAEDFQGD